MDYKLQLCIIKELKAKKKLPSLIEKKSVNLENLYNHENTDEILYACNILNFV